jgi:2-octaprenyl-6-methoxyphenol hydroxylase
MQPDISTMEHADVIVIGGGPTGLAAAGSLARQGLRILLVAQAPVPGVKDQRTAALFNSSVELLRRLDAWDALAAEAAPLAGIRIIDDTDAWLKAPELLFQSHEVGEAQFGFNVPNTALVAALSAAVAALPEVRTIDAAVTAVEPGADGVTVRTADGAAFAAPLVVAADGRNSIGRAAAGIGATAWSYPQTAITTRFRHSRPHRGISTEFHRTAGPCTVVPLPGGWSSLVWVERPAIAARLDAADDAAFAAALAGRLHGLLGSISDVA